jgi:amino acid transporter
MALVDWLLGRPLSSLEDSDEKIGVAEGVPIFGLDALGSAAYGPEAALTLLIPLGAAGAHYSFPISICIVVLLAIVYFSYRQTIEAYPSGGGSYTVASENLGRVAGLLAASALMIDYVLVVAVGIAAGVGALVSAVPSLVEHTLAICLVILALITIVNLRGVRDTGVVFMIPTYVFVACILTAIAMGVWKVIATGGHPVAVVPPHKLGTAVGSVSLWLLVRAFSSGCTAMTGVEAVSNGVMAFREPRTQVARRALTIIIAILMTMLVGIGYLCREYSIGATEPGQSGYESVLSQLVGAVMGKGWFYYVTIASILVVLSLQANTSFAGFPRLCSIVAHDGYLPRAFANRGRRLVYSQGIYVLVVLAAVLLIFFGGVTDRLIPLFAVGAFLAFTFSQAGMVAHWKRTGGPHARHSMVLNGVGATATGATVLIVTASKFLEGAWVTLLLIPGLYFLMKSIRWHYDRVAREVAGPSHISTENLFPPLVVVPIEDWTRIAEKALRFALTISQDVIAVHIDSADQQNHLSEKWDACVGQTLHQAGLPNPKFVQLQSPYRYVVTPIVDYVLSLANQSPGRQVAVLLPTLVERRWFQTFLHNQRSELLTALLLFKGGSNIAIINVPWYLRV